MAGSSSLKVLEALANYSAKKTCSGRPRKRRPTEMCVCSPLPPASPHSLRPGHGLLVGPVQPRLNGIVDGLVSAVHDLGGGCGSGAESSYHLLHLGEELVLGSPGRRVNRTLGGGGETEDK